MALFRGSCRLKCSISLFVLLGFLYSTSGSAAAKTYTGNVKSFLTSTIAQGGNGDFNGVIMHVARVGEIIEPEIRNVKTGKIIREGTPLIKLRPDYFAADVLAAQSNLLGAKADLTLATEQYQRASKLISSKTISVQLFQKAKAEYYDALSKLETANALVIQSENIFESFVIKAPFIGIVDEVLLSSGTAAGQPNIITISQLSPIKIEVPMSRADANNIKINTPVTVYSVRDSKPVGIFHGYTNLTEKGIVFASSNRKMNVGRKDSKGKEVPSVHKIFSVNKFYRYSDSNVLCIPRDTVFKDSKGSYIWKANGEKNNQPGKGISSLFSVSKKYIVLGNLKRNITGYLTLVSLKKSSGLQEYDIVIADPPGDLKDGDTVCYSVDRFQFMPGDQVKVVIGK
jgi:RND family efflux transporter MFP subunit